MSFATIRRPGKQKVNTSASPSPGKPPEIIPINAPKRLSSQRVGKAAPLKAPARSKGWPRFFNLFWNVVRRVFALHPQLFTHTKQKGAKTPRDSPSHFVGKGKLPRKDTGEPPVPQKKGRSNEGPAFCLTRGLLGYNPEEAGRSRDAHRDGGR